MKKTAQTFACLAATTPLLLSACSSSDASNKSFDITGGKATSTTTSDTPKPKKTHYGDTVKYDDGLEVAVETAGSTTIQKGEKAPDCHRGDPVRLFKVTFTNGTDSKFRAYEDTSESLTFERTNGYDDTATDFTGKYDGKKIKGFQDVDPLDPDDDVTRTIGFCVKHVKDGGTSSLTVDTDRGELTDRPKAVFKSANDD